MAVMRLPAAVLLSTSHKVYKSAVATHEGLRVRVSLLEAATLKMACAPTMHVRVKRLVLAVAAKDFRLLVLTILGGIFPLLSLQTKHARTTCVSASADISANRRAPPATCAIRVVTIRGHSRTSPIPYCYGSIDTRPLITLLFSLTLLLLFFRSLLKLLCLLLELFNFFLSRLDVFDFEWAASVIFRIFSGFFRTRSRLAFCALKLH